jgi:hypothetical protein
VPPDEIIIPWRPMASFVPNKVYTAYALKLTKTKRNIFIFKIVYPKILYNYSSQIFRKMVSKIIARIIWVNEFVFRADPIAENHHSDPS